MYTNIQEGIEYLGITNSYEIFAIGEACRENLEWIEHKKRYEEWKNRFKVPRDLNKSELNKLLKETQATIDYLLQFNRKQNSKIYINIIKDDWIEKKKLIKKRLDNLTKFGAKNKEEVGLNIEKAKQFPIEELLEFNKGGFTSCPYHPERTPSAKWYPQRNKIHCFSCNGDFDPIDIYQKLNNVSFNQAVRALQ
jgi:hypothetical protein